MSDELLGLVQRDGRLFGRLRRPDGSEYERECAVSVEREHRDASGEIVAAGVVASSADGSARVGLA